MGKKVRVLEYLGVIGNGGIESFVFNTTLEINNPNIEIMYYCYVRCSLDNMYYKAAVARGKQVILGKSQATGCKIRKYMARITDLLNCCKENHIDIIHFNISFPFDIFFALPLKLAGYKIIFHTQNANTIKMPVLARIADFFAKPLITWTATTLLACSDEAARWTFPSKAYRNHTYSVVKNAIRSSDFVFDKTTRDLLRSKLAISDKFVVGHVGRFVLQKNQAFLVDVFRHLCDKEPNSVLLLIGSGVLEDEIKEKVEKYGLSDHIIFCGNTNKVNEFYQAMDCFVLPSFFEGLGIVAVEAQAAGLKTLCSDVVPREAKVTELMEYMSLTETADKWAMKILSYNNGYFRKNMLDEIVRSGYDIKASAKQLEDLYLEDYE